MRVSRSWWVALVVGGVGAVAVAAPSGPALSADARQLAERVQQSADHGHRPYAIVDKNAAVLFVFDAEGRLAGSSTALLGRDRGDGSAPGVGERAQTGRLRPGDATTPAGRFVSAPGRNLGGEAVVWLDWSAALAIHRLRSGASLAERTRRLASRDPRDKRASAGCVVVPAAFFDAVVQPLLGRGPGVVYVMPEQGTAAALARDPAEE
jgi:hypothetical protein